MEADIKGKLSFRGGVHPPAKKGITCESAIQAGPAVKEVAVMLSQHMRVQRLDVALGRIHPLVLVLDMPGRKSVLAFLYVG